MGHKFADIVFTPDVKAIQQEAGSREQYATLESMDDHNHVLRQREVSFITSRDSFYLASISESGWPYVQHRGGPKGFIKVLDEQTLGFADYSGNRQYVSTGNVASNNRVSLFLMDYTRRRRLKMLGHMTQVEDPAITVRLEDPEYPAVVERAFVIRVAAFDWNCPQHITQRFTEEEWLEFHSN